MILKNHTRVFVFVLTASLIFLVSMPAFAQMEEPTEEPTDTDTIPALVETTVGDVLRFGVPEGWVTDPADEDVADDIALYIMGSDYAALVGSSASPLQMTGEQQVIAMRWSGPEAVPFLAAYGGEITLDAVVQSQIDGLGYGNAELLSGPEPLIVKDWRAQNFKLSLESSDLTVYIVEVKRGESYMEFLGYAAKDNLDAVDAVTRAVAGTVDYNLIVDWLHVRRHRPPLNRKL